MQQSLVPLLLHLEDRCPAVATVSAAERPSPCCGRGPAGGPGGQGAGVRRPGQQGGRVRGSAGPGRQAGRERGSAGPGWQAGYPGVAGWLPGWFPSAHAAPRAHPHTRTHARAHDPLPSHVLLTAVSPVPNICWRLRLFVKSVEMWIEPYCVPALLCAGPWATPRPLRHSSAFPGLPATGEMDNKRPVPRQTESCLQSSGGVVLRGARGFPRGFPRDQRAGVTGAHSAARTRVRQMGRSWGAREGQATPIRPWPKPAWGLPLSTAPHTHTRCPRSRPSSPTTAVQSCWGGSCDTPSSARWPGRGASAPATSSGPAW